MCIQDSLAMNLLRLIQTMGVRGQLEHPPLSYKKSLISTPATGGNQRQKEGDSFTVFLIL